MLSGFRDGLDMRGWRKRSQVMGRSVWSSNAWDEEPEGRTVSVCGSERSAPAAHAGLIQTQDSGVRPGVWTWTVGTTSDGHYQGHGWNWPGTDCTQENPLWLTKNEIVKECIYLKGRRRKRSQTKKLNETDNLERIKFTPKGRKNSEERDGHW